MGFRDSRHRMAVHTAAEQDQRASCLCVHEGLTLGVCGVFMRDIATMR